jgi:hypothetical protein
MEQQPLNALEALVVVAQICNGMQILMNQQEHKCYRWGTKEVDVSVENPLQILMVCKFECKRQMAQILIVDLQQLHLQIKIINITQVIVSIMRPLKLSL